MPVHCNALREMIDRMKSMSLPRIAVLWLLLLSLSPLAQALDPHRSLDHYGRQVWRTDSGLPQNTVHSILQTRDGYVWLGTDGGLVRFDGIDFATFNVENTPQFGSDTVTDLQQDAAGTLWISTADGLLSYRNDAFTVYTTARGLPANVVWFSYRDHQQRLWAMTAGGPAFFNGQIFVPVDGTQSAVPLDRRALVEDNQGTLWLGGSGGVFSLDVRSGAPRLVARLPTGVGVDALLLGKEPIGNRQTLWIGSNEGLQRWSDGKLTPVPLPLLPARTEVTALFGDGAHTYAGTAGGILRLASDGAWRSLGANGTPVKHVNQFYRDRQGNLWVGSEQGAYRIDGDQVQSFAAGSELASDRILAIREDFEGNLWWGTETGGLHLLRDQKIATYTTRDGLSGNVVRSVFQTFDGTLWVGTDGAGLNRRTPSGFRHYTTADGLSSNVILSLAGGAGKSLWVGTPDGLNLLETQGAPSDPGHKVRVTKFTSADGLPDDFIRSLYADQDKTLWIGTRHGLAHMVDGRFKTFSAMDGLGSDFIGAIYRAVPEPGRNQGDLWIGTSGGLTRMRGGAFTNFTAPEGPSHNTVTAIAQRRDDSLWLGTNGGGLQIYRKGVISPADSAIAQSLPGTIYGMLPDPGRALWLSAPTGIYRVTGADGAGTAATVTAYGTADGMNIRECSGGGHPTACRLNDGSLWFATLDGVSAIDPSHTPINQVPPPVVIESVLVDDRPQPMDRELTLKPGTSRLEFRYAGLSYRAPQKVRYRYLLENFDKRWIDAGNRRAAFYTNLPPGHFRFHVWAANNDGMWNDTGAVVALRLLPHYYQTYWFYAALLLATAVLGYLAYRWRVRQVEAQFGAVLAERGRLAREIHDTLAQGFVGISVQLEVLARLLAGATHAPPKPAMDQLDQARAQVRESLAEARTSIWDLRSDNTAVEDLPARLTRSCHRLASDGPAKVYLQVKGTHRPVSRRIEEELLRIGQEAVANAARHAAATRIHVELIYEVTRMLLVVVDDGQGFTPLPGNTSPAGHYGIQGMYERAQQIGARLKLESAPGAGVRITVETPLP